MRTISADQEVVYGLDSRQIALKVQVLDGGNTFRDLTSYKGINWVIGADWGEDVDAKVMDASVSLWRSQYQDSIAPMMETSRLNLISGSYDPLLDVGRPIVISVAIMPEDAPLSSATFVEMFRGTIDKIDWKSEEIKLSCRDQGGYLQDTFLEEVVQYNTAGADNLEDTMQQILDDNLDTPPTLYVPTTPLWAIAEFQSQQQSVLDQLTLLSDMIGWYCRYKWDSGTSAFRLTLYEIDRSKTTPDREFAPSQYFDVTQMNKSIDDVRNRITVVYQTGTDSNGDMTTATYLATDPTSEATYGPRWMGIQEAYSSGIDTATEAQRLAEAALNDLSTPLHYHEVTMPLFHAVELGDLYTFTADGTHFSTDQDLAVVSYRHSIYDEEASTTITSYGPRVVGGKYTWQQKSATTGDHSANGFFGLQGNVGTSLADFSVGVSDYVSTDVPHVTLTLATPRFLSSLAPRKGS